MAKVQIKINLALVKGFFSCRIQGRDSVKDCICIPKENLYQGKDGALYLDFVGYEDTQQKFGRLYSLKQSFSRAEYLALSEEEKKRIEVERQETEIRKQQKERDSVVKVKTERNLRSLK